MNDETRIDEFKKITAADPDNEMGHFSLGKACFDAGRYAEAEPAFLRVLELNPRHSKSYQLLGESQLKLGKGAEAVETLKRGYVIAAESGDVMPREGIARALRELGEALPEVKPAVPAPAAAAVAPEEPAESGGDDGFRCTRCGRPSGKLPERPFRGELGERVLARICSNCWGEWLGMGTKVINEMGLTLADPQAQQVYDEQMKAFLQLED